MSKKVSEDIYDYKHRLKHDVARLVFKPCMCDVCTKGLFVESPFYIFPDGEAHECPDFPDSLDECFKWLIPELLLQYPMGTVYQMLDKWAYWLVFERHNEFIMTESATKLVEAIEQMIDNANKEV